jgi:hypothetical protein
MQPPNVRNRKLIDIDDTYAPDYSGHGQSGIEERKLICLGAESLS